MTHRSYFSSIHLSVESLKELKALLLRRGVMRSEGVESLKELKDDLLGEREKALVLCA